MIISHHIDVNEIMSKISSIATEIKEKQTPFAFSAKPIKTTDFLQIDDFNQEDTLEFIQTAYRFILKREIDEKNKQRYQQLLTNQQLDRYDFLQSLVNLEKIKNPGIYIYGLASKKAGTVVYDEIKCLTNELNKQQNLFVEMQQEISQLTQEIQLLKKAQPND